MSIEGSKADALEGTWQALDQTLDCDRSILVRSCVAKDAEDFDSCLDLLSCFPSDLVGLGLTK